MIYQGAAYRAGFLAVMFALAVAARGDAPVPGREELFRIAYDGMKQNPLAWFRGTAERITRVHEIKIPENPQAEILRSGDLRYFCEVTWSWVQGSPSRGQARIERVRCRFEVIARRDGTRWALARAGEAQGTREKLDEEIRPLAGDYREAVANMPNLLATGLDALYGEGPHGPAAPAAPANPFAAFRERIAAVAEGDGSSIADASAARAN